MFHFFSSLELATFHILLEASVVSEDLEHAGLSRLNQHLHQVESSVTPLLTASHQAGILNADSLQIIPWVII